jgi:hypothetical protein
VNYYCPPGSTNSTAASCPTNSITNSTGSDSIEQCICSKGYFGSNGIACNACIEGKFKSINGNTTCSSCPINSTTISIASNSIQLCQCSIGYNGSAAISLAVQGCIECPIGNYKNFIGNDALCTSCPIYSSTLSTGKYIYISI